MGNIRAAAMYSNPRFDLCGVVDSNVDEAAKLANKYHVRTIDCCPIQYIIGLSLSLKPVSQCILIFHLYNIYCIRRLITNHSTTQLATINQTHLNLMG